MTGPKAGIAEKETPQFLREQRFEQDKWEALNLHTAGCRQCFEARQVHGQTGYGCAVGNDIRSEWLAAAKRRWEQSPQYVATQDRQRGEK